MHDGKWEIHDGILFYRDQDENVIIPNAREIYNIVFKNENKINERKVSGDLSRDIHGLQFSRIPVELKINLESVKTDEEQQLVLQVFAGNQYLSQEIKNFSGDIADHIVIEQTWFPFVQGDLEYISDILEQAGITSAGRISLKQYLKLRFMAAHEAKIQDNIVIYKENTGLSTGDSINIPFFSGSLYPYQCEGYNWLRMISREDAGCILGDEMGLGKTIQIIALLAYEKSKKRTPSLVITPPTLMENWRREILKFAPDLNIAVHKGQHRTGFHSVLKNNDLIITSYDIVLRDFSMLKMINWDLVILDEAHSIKNPFAKRTVVIKQIPRRVSIAVTGTPLQNHLNDLWSIVDFAIPGYLGDLKTFENNYPDSIESAGVLEQLVSPLLLRRLVKDVACDLPKRIDIPQSIEMSKQEAIEYEEVRQEICKEYGQNASLVSLAKLRMYCTHPFLIDDRSANPEKYSLKYQRLLEILEEIMENGEKTLIFTSFSKMIDILHEDIGGRYGIFCEFIDGRVPVDERQVKIDNFERIEGAAVLVLNPRAAGAGLNITAANHVIHYNLEWNPAVEDQASARAYRRGQKRPVTVHRLFYIDTVEEVIDMRITNKRMIAETAIVGTTGGEDSYTDILRAINISPIKGEV